jgi:hypothetical protein
MDKAPEAPSTSTRPERGDLGYQLAHEYLNSGGTAGLPVLRFGTCMRVPRWALQELVTTGRVARLADASVPTAGLRRAR